MLPDVVLEGTDGREHLERFLLVGIWHGSNSRYLAFGIYNGLIVALSTDEFNWNSKQKKCYFTYEKRKQLLEAIRYVDLVIPEENWEQKKTDVQLYQVDTFVIGDDWEGKFDFLKDYCEVVYLPRTPEISTTQIKKNLAESKK